MPKFLAFLNRVVLGVEGVVAAFLVVMAAIGAVDIALAVADSWPSGGMLGPEAIVAVLDTVLVVFIVVELFRIALAYLQHKNVVGTVLEAGLVAVARKLVIFEGGDQPLQKAIALSVLLVAVGGTWYLLRRADVCSPDNS